MNTVLKAVAFSLLTASLAAPLASAKPIIAMQDHDDHDRDHDRDNRAYDREHHDYHEWNAGEDQYYRQWLGERHKSYREFNKLKARDQQAYWNWRHAHDEHEHHN